MLHGMPDRTGAGSTYPTKEEILSGLMEPDERVKEIVRDWKHTHYGGWAEKNRYLQFDAISELLTDLAHDHDPENRLKVSFDRAGWRYYPAFQTIVGDYESPSIISALHELGHHFYGSSELLACRYSVGLFKECFPASYGKLVWKGHMLVKQA